MKIFSTKNTLIISAIALFITLVASFYLGKYTETEKLAEVLGNFRSIREKRGGSYYTSPLLGVHTPESSNGALKDLRKGAEAIASYYKEEGSLTEYSFFYQDLNSSLWFNIDGDNSYLPASLAKLPVALIIERKIEEGSLSEDKKLFYSKEMELKKKQNTTALPSILESGREYSVKDLLVAMISNSDNVAKDLLSTLFDQKSIEDLYEVVGFDLPFYGKEISPNQYAFFFKILYNSSYLSRTHSEFLLSLLAGSTYKEALVKELPKNVKVAHKYGLYNLTKLNPSKPELELHDCGIVYHLEHPYIICVMTRGKDEAGLSQFIADISKYVYNAVDTPTS